MINYYAIAWRALSTGRHERYKNVQCTPRKCSLFFPSVSSSKNVSENIRLILTVNAEVGR